MTVTDAPTPVPVALTGTAASTSATRVTASSAATTPAGWSAGYGLRNVNERLLLHYGQEAGLSIDSREGEGTQVSFSIPIMEESP